jgi:menaquinone-specific isochorismate synthase
VAAKDDRFTAVANAVVTPDADLDYLAERIWAAHEKFKSFDYGTASAEPGERISFHDDPEGQAQFRETVSFALERIRRGELEKVVPARVLDAEIETEFRPFESLYRLRERFSGCTVFSFSDGSPACFLGATPERLIRLESGILRTEAIAGTRPRGFSPGEDAQLGQELLRSDKDLREHRAVIGALSERLRSLGLQPGFRAMPRLLRLRNVQHLVTSIRAEAGGLAFFDAVAALHPTPAIGGAPRDASREFIREQEEFPRGLFTGALGWVDAHNGGEAFVGIRAALAEGTRLRLYGGAGIVAGSDPQQEDEEVTAKLRALRDIFEKQQG